MVATADYGPYTPGFVGVKYGDLEALEGAVTPHTAAVLIEPIQGEAGVLVPPAGYLAEVRRMCDENNVLFIADEIQSGLGRTGQAAGPRARRGQGRPLHPGQGARWRHPAGVRRGRPREVLGVLEPGSHGSTFGGNPLACAVGRAVIASVDARRHARAGNRSRSTSARAAGASWSATGSPRCAVAGSGPGCSWPRARSPVGSSPSGPGRARHPGQGDPGDHAAVRPADRHHRDEIDWAVDILVEVLAAG